MVWLSLIIFSTKSVFILQQLFLLEDLDMKTVVMS